MSANSATSGGLVINVTYDQSQSSLPAGFVAAVNYVVAYYESIFTASATVNIDVGYGEIAGQSLGAGALGESETYINSVPYSQAVAALEANNPSALDQSAYAALPANSPFGSDTLWVATAQEKALGLIPANGTAIDGYVGFSSVYPFSYSPTATPAANEYYFVGVVEHEFSEVMGRSSFLGDTIAGTTSYSIMDLFRYSAPGERDLTAQPPVQNSAYFSLDNGTTNLGSWNTGRGGDLGDWASTAGADAYLAFSPSGQTNSVTSADLTLMAALGWQPTPVISSDVIGSGSTIYVSSGQTSSGLTVLSGGVVDVLAGGTAIDMTVSGGMLVVSGLDISATLRSGGTELVLEGGTASNTTVDSGGLEKVYGAAGGVAIGNGGSVQVESGGIIGGGTVGGGTVAGGALANLATDRVVTSGGTQFDSASAASGMIATAGGQIVENAATTGSVIVVNGGAQVVEPGGFASGTGSTAGEAAVVSIDSGRAIGGNDHVHESATRDTTYRGGSQIVEVGGTSENATPSSGAAEAAFGIAGGAAIKGAQHDYGAATGDARSSDGLRVIEAGETASGAVVSRGDVELVFGAAGDTTVNSGGVVCIESAGIGSGITISGGTANVTSGGSVLGTVAFSAGGSLVLGNSADFGGLIAGFSSNDMLDLADIAYVSSGASATAVSWTQLTSGAGASGLLTVSQGSHVADVALLGQYAGNFTVGSDGQGGTIVADSLPTSNLVLAAPQV